MIKTMGILSTIAFLFISYSVSQCTAAECQYGSVYAFMQSSDETWVNATAHPVLKRGATLKIKIVVVPKTALNVFFLKLHEYGTPVFEVVEGPTEIEHLLECREGIFPNQLFVNTWTIRVRRNTTWVNGYAPLELFVQFNKDDTNEHRISFDVFTAYITDDLIEENTYENTKGNFTSNVSDVQQPGFEFVHFMIPLVLLMIWHRFKNMVKVE